MVTTLTEGYKEYKGKISYEVYKDICSRFNIALKDLIIEGFEYKLPYSLGFLRIKEYRHKKFDENGKLVKGKIRVDYGSTIKHYKQLWNTPWKETQKLLKEKKEAGEVLKYIYHFNEDTDGLIYRWFWDKFYPLRNKRFFRFKPAKDSKLKLSRYIKNNKRLNYLK